MAATSFKLRGLEPPDLRAYPADVHKQFWGWIVELGIKAKVKDLRAGLDKDGNPLRAISPKTRKYRKSAMTPSGKGDPSAPPLIPGRLLSRTISLLAGRALSTHAEFFWRYDAFTGRSWGDTLAIQARQGRDVFGLSPDGTARVRVAAWDRWRKWKAGKYPAQPVAQPAIAAAVGIPQVGSYDMSKATFGIGVASEAHFARGTWTGGMTRAESDRYFRQPARVAIPGRPGTDYNVILRHVWGKPAGPATPMPAPPPRPKPIPKPVVVQVARVALKPVPKPPPAPVPPKPVKPPKPAAPAKPLPPLKPPSSLSPPSTATIGAKSADFDKASQKIFGRVLTDQELANLSGVARGKIYVEVYADSGEIAIRGDTKEYTVHRSLKLGPGLAGKPILKANSFYVKDRYQGKGLGTDVFGRMVEQAEKSGIERISTHAARSDTENGYYTWARFGYDGPLPDHIKAKLPASMRGAGLLSDLMLTPEGTAWWKTHGESIYLSFDPRPGSKSRQVWDAYRTAKASSTPTSTKPN